MPCVGHGIPGQLIYSLAYSLAYIDSYRESLVACPSRGWEILMENGNFLEMVEMVELIY